MVTDMGSNCIELSKMLGVNEHNFIVSLGRKFVIYFFDPPHMIKALRNNLLNYDIRWDEERASWKDIQFFLIKILLELVDWRSTFEKMRVKFASQVISHTVSAALETYVD